MALEMDRLQRGFVGMVLPAWFLGATFVPYLVLRGDLPDPIAVHFDAEGVANGSMSVWVYALFMAAMTVPASAVLVWASWRRRSTIGIEAAIAAFVGWLAAVLNIQVLLANRGVDDWHEVTLGAGSAWGAAFSAVGVAIPVAFLVRTPRVPAGEPPAPAMVVRDGERVAWFGRSRNLPFGLISLALLAVGTIALVNLGRDGLFGGLALFVAALAMVGFMSVDVEISDDAVRVHGPIPVPRIQFPLDDIERARAIEFKGMGRTDRYRGIGWGYRGSLRVWGWAAWALRDGPAVELDLVDDRRFIVTVDGADEAAALVNGLVDRRRGATARPC